MRGSIALLIAGLGVFAYVPARAEAPDGNKAPVVIRMSVPAGAQVSFDGTMTEQTGAQRKFESPPIATDKTFKYQIVVKDGDKVVTRTVRVMGGDWIFVVGRFARRAAPAALSSSRARRAHPLPLRSCRLP
jgi:uncharacterized protein (TIGR03000 family)